MLLRLNSRMKSSGRIKRYFMVESPSLKAAWREREQACMGLAKKMPQGGG
jgi:hypothetical protein